MTKKIIFIGLFVSLISLALFSSCASSSSATTAKKALLTKTSSRMFYRIDGLDENDNPATVYIQATFHLGDERILPLSEEVNECYKNANRLVGEVSSEDWTSISSQIEKMTMKSYFEAAGRTISSALDQKQKDALQTHLGDSKTLTVLDVLEPWCTIAMLSAGAFVDSGLTADYSFDGYFMNTAIEDGRKVEGLDTLQTQLDIVRMGDYEAQLIFLKCMLDELAEEEKAFAKTTAQALALYDAYLADDEKKLADLVNKERKEDFKKNEAYKDYYYNLFDKRNADWADDIERYLSEGGTTFIFAGAAHFVGEASVFDVLKKKGLL